jgi:hypothetical protein
MFSFYPARESMLVRTVVGDDEVLFTLPDCSEVTS